MNLSASLKKSFPSFSSDNGTKKTVANDSIDDLTRLSKPFESYEKAEILCHSLALTDLIYGLYGVELWTYNEGNGKLVNVPLCKDEEIGSGGCGMFIKRSTQEADPSNGYSTQDAVDAYRKLTDPSFEGFLPALDTDVGVGLPGLLWSETRAVDNHRHGHGHGHGNNNISWRNVNHRHGHGRGHGNNNISWRNVEDLANDPHQPYDDRLQLFAKAGLKLAAGIGFGSNGFRGIVVFFSNPHAPKEKLHDPINLNFMHIVAQSIGSAAAAQAHLEEMKTYRKKLREDNWRKLKIKVTTIVRFGGTLRKDSAKSSQLKNTTERPTKRMSSMEQFRQASVYILTNAGEVVTDARESAKSKTSRYLKKLQGGSAGIPPSFSNSQTLLTFIGVFITHLILSRLNLLIQTQSNKELSLVLAPLGAFTTLQYCLTAAPAAQPRNAFFAQVFAVSTAILLNYIPNIDPWFRSALAPAIVIPCMARFGIIHPPAGAASVVFSSGKYGWEHMGIFLSGVCISILTAVLINNWSDKRQYPTSWYLLRKAKSSCLRELDK